MRFPGTHIFSRQQHEGRSKMNPPPNLSEVHRHTCGATLMCKVLLLTKKPLYSRDLGIHCHVELVLLRRLPCTYLHTSPGTPGPTKGAVEDTRGLGTRFAYKFWRRGILPEGRNVKIGNAGLGHAGVTGGGPFVLSAMLLDKWIPSQDILNRVCRRGPSLLDKEIAR